MFWARIEGQDEDLKTAVASWNARVDTIVAMKEGVRGRDGSGVESVGNRDRRGSAGKVTLISRHAPINCAYLLTVSVCFCQALFVLIMCACKCTHQN